MAEQGEALYDLLVIGGGINGVSIAADGAGRGLKVMLAEMNDLASATSSASSKLLHGGLRYLEYYEFRLVREALAEREVLLRMAPHIVSPLRFRLPHRPHLRPAWLIRLGLFLYDNLGRRVTLPPSHGIRFGADSVLKPGISRGFEYSDCWVDDARLVVLTASQAKQQGAEIRTRTRCVTARRDSLAGHWQVVLEDTKTGRRSTVHCRGLVNAAGPWVDRLYHEALGDEESLPRGIRLIKGSHLVVPRLHDQPQAYILQHDDKRIVFVIPWLETFSLIGTTDVEYRGDPADVAIDEQETEYLLTVVNQHFSRQLTRHDVVSAYAGVRPLCDDEAGKAAAVTRDYTLELADIAGTLPLLSVFGGKLTTARKLGEAALDRLAPYFPQMGGAWTATARLPGGDFYAGRDALCRRLLTQYPWLPEPVARRYVATYGTCSFRLLKGCDSLKGMGTDLGHGLYSKEVEYLWRCEWAQSSEDILWRRTRLGFWFSPQQVQQLDECLHRLCAADAECHSGNHGNHTGSRQLC